VRAGPAPIVHRRGRGGGPLLAAAVPGLLALAVGTAAVATARLATSMSLVVVLAAGCGMLAVLALALWRYDAAVVLALLLLGAVQFEPAPVDAVLAVLIAAAVVTGRPRLDIAPAWTVALVGLFAALVTLSLVEVSDPPRGLGFAAITCYLIAFALWTAGYVDSTRRARIVVTCYVAVAALSAVLGGIAVLTGVGAEVLTRFARAQALFKDPNVFGPFVVVAAIFVLGELIEPRLLRWRPWVKTLLFALLLCGVLFSYSRGAWVNLVVALVVLGSVVLIRRGAPRRVLMVLLTGLGAVAVVAATVVLTGSLAFLQERARLQSYDIDRFGVQRLGLQIGGSHPIGIGPGQFESAAPISAHSTYVRVLAEQGVPGLAVLLCLLAGTLWLAVRNTIAGETAYGIGSGALLAVWVGLLVNSVVVDTLHWRHLWLVAGLISAASVAHRGPGSAHAAPRGRAASPV
jgi:O-antigen ligase